MKCSPSSSQIWGVNFMAQHTRCANNFANKDPWTLSKSVTQLSSALLAHLLLSSITSRTLVSWSGRWDFILHKQMHQAGINEGNDSTSLETWGTIHTLESRIRTFIGDKIDGCILALSSMEDQMNKFLTMFNELEDHAGT